VARSHTLSLLLLPLLAWAAPACRPSKADFDAVSSELERLRAEQSELQTRLSQLEDRDAHAQARAQIDVDSVAGGLIDVTKRIVVLEERAAKAAKPSFPKPDPAAVYRVEIGDSHVKGPVDALVTVVMWTDYQCPYCARVQPTMTQLEEIYGRDIRFVHKHNPLGFHPQAMPAALGSEAAGKQGKFWEMHDKIFENQKDLADERFIAYATELGLDVEQFKKDMASDELKKKITEQQTQGVTLGARGTPAFFVNGRFLSGAQPLENFQTLIDEELAKARVLVDRGVPRMQVYEVTIAEGRTKL
jgi:protein-disulfide isomerase